MNSAKDWGKYFAIGALAGAAGGIAGQAVAGVVGAGGFIGGAITGSASGFAGGFVNGAGNAWAGGASLGQGLGEGLISGGFGALSGGLVGDISGAIQYRRQISVFQKGCVNLGVDGGDPVPATDQFLSDAQKAWYKNAPMDRVKAFTVENVPQNQLTKLVKNNAAAKTVPISTSKGVLTGDSRVYFNKDIAFSSAKQLFFTMGHEFVHVSQFAVLTGQSRTLLTSDFLEMLEFHAYSYQNFLGGIHLNGFTRDQIINWSATYSHFNSMSHTNFHWAFNHSFIYPF